MQYDPRLNDDDLFVYVCQYGDHNARIPYMLTGEFRPLLPGIREPNITWVVPTMFPLTTPLYLFDILRRHIDDFLFLERWQEATNNKERAIIKQTLGDMKSGSEEDELNLTELDSTSNWAAMWDLYGDTLTYDGYEPTTDMNAWLLYDVGPLQYLKLQLTKPNMIVERFYGTEMDL
jgi:hypothetical protein